MTKTTEVSIVNLLGEEYVSPESVFDTKRTKTSHYMLNTIFHNSSLMSTEYFVNAYLDDEELSHKFFRPLFLVFKVTPKDTKWNTIAPRLRAKPEYLMEYFVGVQDTKHLIVMVFQIPDKYAKDYINFKQGKYSLFTPEYKKLFARYTANERAQPVESKIWQVIHKTKELKAELEKYFTVNVKDPFQFGPNDELWGIPEPKYEHFRHKTTEEDERKGWWLSI